MARGGSPQLVQDTRRFFQDRTGHAVTDGDAAEAIRNVSDLFTLLAEWERPAPEDKEPEHAS